MHRREGRLLRRRRPGLLYEPLRHRHRLHGLRPALTSIPTRVYSVTSPGPITIEIGWFSTRLLPRQTDHPSVRASQGAALIDDVDVHPGTGRIKLALTRRLLALRNEFPDLFTHGAYRPLDVTGVDRDHTRGSVLEQAVREASGGGAHIKADFAGNVDPPIFESAFQLQTAAADIFQIFAKQPDCCFRSHLRAGFLKLLIVDQHLAGENERLRTLPLKVS